MARGSISLLQPCTAKSSWSGLLVHSSRALRLLDKYTCGQTNSVPGCTTCHKVLRRKEQVLVCSSSRHYSAASESFNNYCIHSNSSPDCGRNWPAHARSKFPSGFGEDSFVGENRRCHAKGAAKCQVQTRAETGVLTSKPEESGRLFIFGFGFTSYALAVLLRNQNWNVTGTCRSCEVRSKLEDCGFHTFLFNSDNDGEELKESGLKELQQATHWLVSIPPVGDFDKDPVLAAHGQDLIESAARGNVRWIGYLSSTGVYGDWQGEWVDEETEPRPFLPRAVARLAAEKDWLNFGKTHGVAVHIFRLGGIYGAGRNAFSTIIQNGTRSKIQRERRQFTSRIHVADVCQVLTASMDNPCPGRIYNVVDDVPASRKEVFAYARDLLGQRLGETEAPEEATTGGDTKASLIYSTQCEEKRVSNRRIKEELQIQLLHPSYKSGLEEILTDSLRIERCI